MMCLTSRFKPAVWLFCALTGIILAVGAAYSQQKGFTIRHADVLNVLYVGNQQIQALIGNVSMVHPSASGEVKIWCDSAFRNLQTNVVRLFGNVRIVRDSLRLNASEGTYYGNERRAEMPRGVRLTKGRMLLTAQAGQYWASEKRALFRGDVRVVDSTSSTFSDVLVYFEDEEKSIAIGNVRVFNPENNLTIFGDSLVHFEKEKYTIVPKKPRLMQIDTTSSGAVDTLVVAGIVAQAGRLGTVTIATNMAGRGTDILLGGNPESLAKSICLERSGKGWDEADEESRKAALAAAREVCAREHEAVVGQGGLHILGTERHEARRIDNQLRGRAGRQGDPGSSRFYLSLQDDLMRRFASWLMERALTQADDMPIESGMVSRAIEKAQKQVEAQNFEIRKRLLEYDDVQNLQRQELYGLRRELLEGKNQRDYVMEKAGDVLDSLIASFLPSESNQTPAPEELAAQVLHFYGFADVVIGDAPLACLA